MSREESLAGKRELLVEVRHALGEFPDLGRQLENPPLPQWNSIADSWLTSTADLASNEVVTNLA